MKPSRNEPVSIPTNAAPTADSAVMLYQAPDGSVALDVRLERETVWLTQKQMVLLFDTERSVITKHLSNIFKSGELDEKSNVQKMHIPGSDKPVAFYNLDAIISVGYRVNSKRGTQFRMWATQVLREHLVRGYTVNARRLAELQQTIRVVSRIADNQSLAREEVTALLRLVRDYADSLALLDDYDMGRLIEVRGHSGEAQPLSPVEVQELITTLQTEYGARELFGREREPGQLDGILAAVFQTAFGKDVYPTIEEKAAHLLYFVVKDHPFADGNKRIGAAVFLRFLDKNHMLYAANGARRISDETLVAMTLLIAESDPKEKDTLMQLVIALLNFISKVKP